MREIILKVLSEVACGNTGTCQINLQSESAQIMIADKLEKELRPFMQSMMEEVFVLKLILIVVGEIVMQMGEHYENIQNIQKLIEKEIFSNNFDVDTLKAISAQMKMLIDSLNFWFAYGNDFRYKYDLEKFLLFVRSFK